MTSNELLIGLGGIIFGILTYFAGVQRQKRQQGDAERSARISKVVEAYLTTLRERRSSGLHGLLKAGVPTLKDDSEIREACRLIEQHGEGSPLAPKDKVLENEDLHAFFAHANRLCRHGPFDENIFNTFSAERILEEMKKHKTTT